MTARAALALLLLDGEVISIKNAFPWLGIACLTNEIRLIEKKFDVKVSKTPRKGNAKFGLPCTWTNYRLNRTSYNEKGIEKMIKYVEKSGINYDFLNTNSIQQLKIIFLQSDV